MGNGCSGRQTSAVDVSTVGDIDDARRAIFARAGLQEELEHCHSGLKRTKPPALRRTSLKEVETAVRRGSLQGAEMAMKLGSSKETGFASPFPNMSSASSTPLSRINSKMSASRRTISPLQREDSFGGVLIDTEQNTSYSPTGSDESAIQIDDLLMLQTGVALSKYTPQRVWASVVGRIDPTSPELKESGISTRSWTGAVLLVDVSGFTALSEHFAKMGSEGIERFTRTMSALFSNILGCIFTFGGDVDCFAGDALLVTFHAESATLAARSAIQCALDLNEKFSPYQACASLSITLHSGIGVGKNISVDVGGGQGGQRAAFIVGEAMTQIRIAHKQSHSGEVIVSPEVWVLLRRSTLKFEKREEGCVLVTKVMKFLPSIRSGRGPAMIDHTLLMSSEKSSLQLYHTCLRYIPAVVCDRIVAGQEDYLGEHRVVTVAFVNMVVDGLDGDPDSLSQNVFDTLQNGMIAAMNCVTEAVGFIRQITYDDKGLVLIFAFGVPGCAHDDDAFRAVHCGAKLLRILPPLGVRCGIGISSGAVYCGSVGNMKMRCDYSLVGDTVNLAARLAAKGLAKYNCIVSSTTAEKVKTQNIDQAHGIIFHTAEKIRVKGKANELTVYSVSLHLSKGWPVVRNMFLAKSAFNPTPLMMSGGGGEEGERQVTTVRHAHYVSIVEQFKYWGEENVGGVLLIQGAVGSGKEKLLEAICRSDSFEDAIVVSCERLGTHPFTLVRSLIKSLALAIVTAEAEYELTEGAEADSVFSSADNVFSTFEIGGGQNHSAMSSADSPKAEKVKFFKETPAPPPAPFPEAVLDSHLEPDRGIPTDFSSENNFGELPPADSEYPQQSYSNSAFNSEEGGVIVVPMGSPRSNFRPVGSAARPPLPKPPSNSDGMIKPRPHIALEFSTSSTSVTFSRQIQPETPSVSPPPEPQEEENVKSTSFEMRPTPMDLVQIPESAYEDSTVENTSGIPPTKSSVSPSNKPRRKIMIPDFDALSTQPRRSALTPSSLATPRGTRLTSGRAVMALSHGRPQKILREALRRFLTSQEYDEAKILVPFLGTIGSPAQNEEGVDTKTMSTMKRNASEYFLADGSSTRFNSRKLKVDSDTENRSRKKAKLFRNLFRALLSVAQECAERKGSRVSLVVGCVHSGDIPSLNVIAWALERIPAARLIGTIRPDSKTIEIFMAGIADGKSDHGPTVIGGKSQRYRTVALEGISKSEMESFAADFLSVSSVPSQLLDFMEQNSEGNPMYCKEILTTLIATKVLVVENEKCKLTSSIESLSLPKSLAGYIVARIDLLPPHLSMVLKVASVLGKTFTTEALEALFPVERQLRQIGHDLDSLVTAAFLTFDAETNMFAFVSSACHEATYSTLLHAYKRQMHKNVALYLEKSAEKKIEVNVMVSFAEDSSSFTTHTRGQTIPAAMQDPSGILQAQLAKHWAAAVGEDLTDVTEAEQIFAIERAAAYKFLTAKHDVNNNLYSGAEIKFYESLDFLRRLPSSVENALKEFTTLAELCNVVVRLEEFWRPPEEMLGRALALTDMYLPDDVTAQIRSIGDWTVPPSPSIWSSPSKTPSQDKFSLGDSAGKSTDVGVWTGADSLSKPSQRPRADSISRLANLTESQNPSHPRPSPRGDPLKISSESPRQRISPMNSDTPKQTLIENLLRSTPRAADAFQRAVSFTDSDGTPPIGSARTSSGNTDSQNSGNAAAGAAGAPKNFPTLSDSGHSSSQDSLKILSPMIDTLPSEKLNMSYTSDSPVVHRPGMRPLPKPKIQVTPALIQNSIAIYFANAQFLYSRGDLNGALKVVVRAERLEVFKSIRFGRLIGSIQLSMGAYLDCKAHARICYQLHLESQVKEAIDTDPRTPLWFLKLISESASLLGMGHDALWAIDQMCLLDDSAFKFKNSVTTLYKALSYLMCVGADRTLCLVYLVPKIMSKVEVFKWVLDDEAMPEQVTHWEKLTSTWMKLGEVPTKDKLRLIEANMATHGEHDAASLLLLARAYLEAEDYERARGVVDKWAALRQKGFLNENEELASERWRVSGMCHYASGDKIPAMESLQKAFDIASFQNSPLLKINVLRDLRVVSQSVADADVLAAGYSNMFSDLVAEMMAAPTIAEPKLIAFASSPSDLLSKIFPILKTEI